MMCRDSIQGKGTFSKMHFSYLRNECVSRIRFTQRMKGKKLQDAGI